jgi:crotonobetainyl-CoA:carnitine CoA-transferase CaiB-like acyl-CoA transferase
VTGEGGRVEVSLLESIFDVMMETFTTFLNDNRTQPQRGPRHSAHSYLSAPYGVYPTADGYLALAMNPVARLGRLLDIPELLQYENRASWFDHRDEITAALAERLKTDTTQHWLAVLEPEDIWCAEVMTWPCLVEHPGFQELDLIQSVSRGDRTSLETTRCPIRIDGQVLESSVAAPRLGQDNERVLAELEHGKAEAGAVTKGAPVQEP